MSPRRFRAIGCKTPAASTVSSERAGQGLASLHAPETAVGKFTPPAHPGLGGLGCHSSEPPKPSTAWCELRRKDINCTAATQDTNPTSKEGYKASSRTGRSKLALSVWLHGYPWEFRRYSFSFASRYYYCKCEK